MKTCSISKLARAFGLSRSTLLYYDEIGLLRATGRTAAGYRTYGEKERKRLEKICRFRPTGLGLAEIRRMLDRPGGPFAAILRRRSEEIAAQIADLKNQQRILSAMLRQAGKATGTVVDKALWVQMMRAAGLDDAGMIRWHGEFEKRSPEGHQEFLASLGIAENEVRSIRKMAAEN